jgi:hypothetical protein
VYNNGATKLGISWEELVSLHGSSVFAKVQFRPVQYLILLCTQKTHKTQTRIPNKYLYTFLTKKAENTSWGLGGLAHMSCAEEIHELLGNECTMLCEMDLF